jgi:hypothetical protein
MLSLFTYGLTFGTSEAVSGTKELAKQTDSIQSPEDTPASPPSFKSQNSGSLIRFFRKLLSNVI